MPATPEIVSAYLAAAGEGCAMPTLRRRVGMAQPVAWPATRSTPSTRRSARRSGALGASTRRARRVEQKGHGLEFRVATPRFRSALGRYHKVWLDKPHTTKWTVSQSHGRLWLANPKYIQQRIMRSALQSYRSSPTRRVRPGVAGTSGGLLAIHRCDDIAAHLAWPRNSRRRALRCCGFRSGTDCQAPRASVRH